MSEFLNRITNLIKSNPFVNIGYLGIIVVGLFLGIDRLFIGAAIALFIEKNRKLVGSWLVSKYNKVLNRK